MNSACVESTLSLFSSRDFCYSSRDFFVIYVGVTARVRRVHWRNGLREVLVVVCEVSADVVLACNAPRLSLCVGLSSAA